MFLTSKDSTHYFPDAEGQKFLDAGNHRKATAMEASEVVSRYVENGSVLMNQVNEDFERIYEDTIAVKGAGL